MYACMYACMYVCVYVCMYVCMYICIYAYMMRTFLLYRAKRCSISKRSPMTTQE